MTATTTRPRQIALAEQLAGINPDTGAIQIIQMWTGFLRGRAAIVTTAVTPDGVRSTQVRRQGGPKHIEIAFGRCTLPAGFVFAEEPAVAEQVAKLNAALGPCTSCGAALPTGGMWCAACGVPQQVD